jgi:broad specificity phosphatase PhoE
MLPRRPFYFLRHGETDLNKELRFIGAIDAPLNAKGIAQAENAAHRLGAVRIDRIVASPLMRALKTAAVVAEVARLPVHIDSGLRERWFGRLEGRVVAEVKRELGLPLDKPMADHLPPDAEQWPATRARTLRVIGTWLEAHPQGELLFVSHGGLFDAMHEVLLGRRAVAGHATPYRWEPVGDGWRVVEVNQS